MGYSFDGMSGMDEFDSDGELFCPLSPSDRVKPTTVTITDTSPAGGPAVSPPDTTSGKHDDDSKATQGLPPLTALSSYENDWETLGDGNGMADSVHPVGRDSRLLSAASMSGEISSGSSPLPSDRVHPQCTPTMQREKRGAPDTGLNEAPPLHHDDRYG